MAFCVGCCTTLRNIHVRNQLSSEAASVINEKSPDSVAIHLKCGGLFNNCRTSNLLLSLLVKEFLKLVNIW